MKTAYTYDDILLIPAYNHYESRREVDISVTDRSEKLTLELPLMSANMDTITESSMCNFMGEQGGIGFLHRFMSIDDNVKEFKKCKFKAVVSVGCHQDDLERLEALKVAGANYFCVDVAHAHARYVGRTLKTMRELLGDSSCLIAGNVATYAGADYLASCGADIIKVGIGGGSVCTTRIKTGFGIPMITSLEECVRVDRSIIADGGIKTAGDIVKALAFGADFVMVGSLLAGTRPTPGEVYAHLDSHGVERKFKKYRGMASKEVQQHYRGQMPKWKTAEGVSTEVAYREDEEEIIADIVGGLRSGLTYAGACSIKELQRKLNYMVITPAGRYESLPHRTL